MKIMRNFLLLISIFPSLNAKIDLNAQNYTKLINFACDLVKDEVKTSPEIRNIAILIGDFKFPEYFIRNIQNCLPKIPQTILNMKPVQNIPK
jgi:hypothetical protein